MSEIDNLFLDNPLALELYQSCKDNPIIDFHCHLSPKMIFEDKVFPNITELWLKDDHYKWRALRLFGSGDELFNVKGNDFELFTQWCNLFPTLLFNPLHNWARLELWNYFKIDIEPNKENSKFLWEELNSKIRSEKTSPRKLLESSKVEVICTSDDPTDNLIYHKYLKEEDNFPIKVLPTFRLDRLFYKIKFNEVKSWVLSLEEINNKTIFSCKDLKDSLIERHNYFHEYGCRMSDHGIETINFISCTNNEAEQLFSKIMNGIELESDDIDKWNSYILNFLIELNHSKNWTTLLHLGAIRNNNSSAFSKFGADNGTDSIGDFNHANGLNNFLDHLQTNNKLHKIILFNSNPADNHLFSSIMGNFYSSGIKNKIQHGPAWWFLDTYDGILEHFNSYSNLGVYENFIGMVTDSRSFLSFTRHDYYRRTLANIVSKKVLNKEIITSRENINRFMNKITYKNALKLFN
jgi:glucuronate isomerase